MKNFPTKKRTALILTLLATVTLITLSLSSLKTNFLSKASPGDFPKNIKISNITDDSITVSYSTDGKVIGNIIFGTEKNNLDYLSLDDRDQLSQISNAYKIHSITLRGLEPNTEYYFSINSGSNNYLNNADLFKVKTGSIITGIPPNQIPAVGSIIQENNTTPPEGIVYLKINNSQLVSSLIKNGMYIIPLNNLRNIQLNEYFTIAQNTDINIEAFSADQGGKSITKPNSLSPVKDLPLGENYNPGNSEFNPTLMKKITNSPESPKSSEESIIDSLNLFNFFKSTQ